MKQLISIIVPIYNAEQYLNRCIYALRNQSYKNIEIILINDGSKDQSLKICQEHGEEDSRIIIIDKKNGGVSSARNAGLDIAKGDYVMFCDSDDWPEHNWCQELIANYIEDCVVMCGYYVEGEQCDSPYEVKTKTENEWIKRDEHYSLHRSGIKVPWNKIFDRKIIENYNIKFNDKLSNGEDYLFLLEYLSRIKGDILFIDECLYHYEWPREQSLSRKITGEYFEQVCSLSTKIFVLAEESNLINENGIKNFKTDFSYEFEKIIIAILNADNLNIKEKLKKMKCVMSSEEYQRCVDEVYISTNRVYSHLFRRKNGLGLWIWHIARQCKEVVCIGNKRKK